MTKQDPTPVPSDPAVRMVGALPTPRRGLSSQQMQVRKNQSTQRVTGKSTSLVGETVGGRYRVQELLASGGMCDIYKARQVSMDRWVALKVMRSPATEGTPYAQWFYREMRAAARIQHPNTVRVYDFGQLDSGSFWLTMELLQGRTLEAELATGGAFAPMRAVHVAMQIAKALNAAHEEGVVHRDLKGDNILLLDLYGERDFVKVVDFGLASMPGPSGFGGLVAGTPEFMAPEQALGQDVDVRADLYALGVLLYHMLTGRLPFTHADAREVLQMQVHRTAVPPSRFVRRGLPEPLDALIIDLMRKAPSERPSTARVVLERLGACAAHPEISRRTHSRWEESSPELIVREPEDRADDAQDHATFEQSGPTLVYRQRHAPLIGVGEPVALPRRRSRRWAPQLLVAAASAVMVVTLLLLALPRAHGPLALLGAAPSIVGASLAPPLLLASLEPSERTPGVVGLDSPAPSGQLAPIADPLPTAASPSEPEGAGISAGTEAGTGVTPPTPPQAEAAGLSAGTEAGAADAPLDAPAAEQGAPAAEALEPAAEAPEPAAQEPPSADAPPPIARPVARPKAAVPTPPTAGSASPPSTGAPHAGAPLAEPEAPDVPVTPPEPSSPGSEPPRFERWAPRDSK